MMKPNVASLLCLLLASFASALDRPAASSLRPLHQNDQQDELHRLLQQQQQDGDTKSCSEKLAECRVYVPNGLPLAEWNGMLAQLDPKEKTFTMDLKELIVGLEAVNFDDVGESLLTIAGAGNEVNMLALRELLMDMARENEAFLRQDASVVEENDVTWLTNFLTTKINAIGFIFHVDVSKLASIVNIIGRMVDLFVSTALSITQGPLGFITTKFNSIAQMAALIGELFLVALGLNKKREEGAALVEEHGEETACMIDMVRCESEKIILNMMPSLLGGVMLVDAVNAAEEASPATNSAETPTDATTSKEP